MKRILTLSMMTLSLSVMAQLFTDDDFDNMFNEYQGFKTESEKEYKDFRDKANQEYADFMEKAWQQYTMGEPEPFPKEENVVIPPISLDDTIETASNCYPAEIVRIYTSSVPKPQPLPIEPIVPYNWAGQGTVTFMYYGTPCEVRFDEQQKFSLPTLDKADIANAWRVMAQPKYNNTINDCLKLRDQKSLNDWGYLQMLQKFATAALGDGNEARLLTAYLYTQSGYKSRILKTLDTPEPRISMLFGTEYMILGKASMRSGNVNYYPIDGNIGYFEYVEYPFPHEQTLSLTIDKNPLLDREMSDKRYMQSLHYPGIDAEVAVDQNLIRFYNDYPAWYESNDIYTRWASYANTPMNIEVKAQLYPQLKSKLDPTDKNKALEQLLNFVQSSFPYAYDDQVWGYDRAFFAEETLFYPGSDCEDHAILFSRLVRDLLDMDVVLVHYPGHLATAVYMGDNHGGDQVMVDGKSYTVCDPTWPGARAGRRMTFVDRSKAKAIKLNK